MQQIDQVIDSAMEGVRARHCWDAKLAAKSGNLHPNRVTTWWRDFEDRMSDIYQDQPIETTAMLHMALLKAESRRRRRQQK